MTDNSDGIHPRRLKSFVRHLCLISKKHKDRENALLDLRKQIAKIKKVSSKKDITGEMNELDSRIALVLEKERQLLGVKQEEHASSRILRSNVRDNEEKIIQINNSLADIRKKLYGYIEAKTKREKRIDELEKRIRAKANKKENVTLLKSKLKKLESMYDKLNSKGVDVSKVSTKIEDLKLRLMS
jgi:chromosome segregation ATPase